MNVLIYLTFIFIINGEVINQTLQRTQQDVRVYLYQIKEENFSLLDSSVTDKRGRFKFEVREGFYLIKGIYKDAIFRNEPFFLNGDTSFPLYIWDLTQKTESVEISRIHIAIITQEDMISVIEAISFKNYGNCAYYKPFEIEIPVNTIDFLPFSGILPDELHLVNNKLLHYFPIIPGESFISYQYRTRGDFEFRRNFPFKVLIFDIFVSPNLKIEGLEKGEMKKIGEKSYLSFRLKNIKENKEIFFKVKRQKRIVKIQEIFPLLIVLIFISIFLIYRWKKGY